MKTYIAIIFTLLSVSITQAQLINNIDFVAPFYDGLAAVQKGESWAFIDEQGNTIIDYRHDLAVTASNEHQGKKYPKFQNGRCLIFSETENVKLYGYIDKMGKTVVTPQFLSSTQFNEHHLAIVQKLNKDSYGTNDLLNKTLVRYTYNEVVINNNGKILNYLNGPTHIIPYMDKMKVAPEIVSQLLSPNLVTTQDDNKKWVILQVTNTTN